MKKLLPFLLFVFVIVAFFSPFIFQNKLPIPSDTIIGLYHPFRDLYAKDYPNGVPFKNFLITDPVRQQYPWRFLSIEMEKRASLPLWNPYSMAGAPLLANMQSGPFYPLNFLLFIFPFSIGWSLLVILQPFLAGLFVYLYLDNLKLRKSASFLGAITFTFCGFSTVWLEWGTIVHTALWLPLIMLCIDKLFFHFKSLKIYNKKLLIWSLLLIFSLSLSLFAGHLQIFFYLFLVSAIYFFARWYQKGLSKKLLFIFFLINILFLILTIAQWLPALQLILKSARNIDQNWGKEGWFIPWQNLVQFFAPDFFGNPTTLNYWGIWNYAEFVGYVGIVPLIMAIFSMCCRKDKKTIFFSVLFFLSLIFSLPTFFAKIPYILQIAFLSSTQPTRLLVIADFALSVLAALGFDFLIRSSKKKQIIYPLLLVGIVFVGLWTVVFTGQKVLLSISAEKILTARRNLYFPTIIFVSITILFVLNNFINSKKVKQGIVLILILIAMIDLFRFAAKFTPYTDKNYLFPPSLALSYLQKQKGEFRIMTTDNRILPPNFSIMYHLQTLDGYDPLYLLRYGELIAAIERNKPDITPPFGYNRIITPNNVRSRLVDLLGVRFVLSLSDIKSPKMEKVFTEGQTRIYENKKAFPRAFFVSNIKLAANKNEAINLMFDDSIDFKNSAIVENWNKSKTDFTKGSIDIVEYKPERIVLVTQSPNEAFLVLMDTFYPTWHARICLDDSTNCQATKTYVTNYNFRGVIVPKGKHKIVFDNYLL